MILLLTGAALGQANTTPEPPNRPVGRAVALVVGVEEYATGKLQELEFAFDDAQAVGRVLMDPDSGHFDAVTIVGPRATHAEIKAAFFQLASGLSDADTFVFYFAGHGSTLRVQGANAPRSMALLKTSDFDPGSETLDGAITTDELKDWLEQSKARHRVVILDVCFTGEGRSSPSQNGGAEQVAFLRPRGNPSLMGAGPDQYWLLAAEGTAWEAPDLGGGVYTHFVLQALEGKADFDGDGRVSVDEVDEYARDATLQWTSAEGHYQVPYSDRRGGGWPAIVLVGDRTAVARPTRAVLMFGNEPDGWRFWLDGDPLGLIQSVLEPGAHHLLARGEEGDVQTDFFVRPGDRVDVGDLFQSHRYGSWLVGASAAVAPLGGVESFGAAGLAAWWIPRHRSDLMLAVGAAAYQGFGPVGDLGEFPTGRAQVSAGLWYGRTVVAGVTAGAGPVWRIPPGGTQAGPMATLGAHAHWSRDPWFIAFDVGANGLLVDAAPVVYPTASLTVGIQR